MRTYLVIRDTFYGLILIIYLLLLLGAMILIVTGRSISKKLVGLTGWSWVINAYKSLHICGEKLSRHIRRMI